MSPPRKEAVRTPNPALSPTGDSDRASPGLLTEKRLVQLLVHIQPRPDVVRCYPHNRHCPGAPAPGRRLASAPCAPAGATPRACSRIDTNLFARGWGRSSSQPVVGSWLRDPEDRTHPAITAGWDTRLPGRQARSPAVPKAQTPARPPASVASAPALPGPRRKAPRGCGLPR